MKPHPNFCVNKAISRIQPAGIARGLHSSAGGSTARVSPPLVEAQSGGFGNLGAAHEAEGLGKCLAQIARHVQHSWMLHPANPRRSTATRGMPFGGWRDFFRALVPLGRRRIPEALTPVLPDRVRGDAQSSGSWHPPTGATTSTCTTFRPTDARQVASACGKPCAVRGRVGGALRPWSASAERAVAQWR